MTNQKIFLLKCLNCNWKFESTSYSIFQVEVPSYPAPGVVVNQIEIIKACPCPECNWGVPLDELRYRIGEYGQDTSVSQTRSDLEGSDTQADKDSGSRSNASESEDDSSERKNSQ